MRALRKDGPNDGLALVEIDQPRPGPGELLVRVGYAGICGTDLSIVQWAPYIRPFVALPRTLGHEFVGTVEAVGPDTSIPVGTRLTADTDGGCGHCRWCRRGARHACERQSRIGTQRDGALAEFVVVPERSVYSLPAAVDDRVACLVEPFAAAVHAVEQLPMLVGRSAAVIGPGPVGLLAGVALEEAGCGPVLVVGLPEDTDRLRISERLGFDAVQTAEAVDRARTVTPLEGVDVVVDAVGSASSLMLAANMARFGGAISVVGLGPVGEVDVSRLVSKELTVTGSWRRLPTTWDRTLNIAARRPDLADLVDGLYGIDDHEAAFAALGRRAHLKTAIRVSERRRHQ